MSWFTGVFWEYWRTTVGLLDKNWQEFSRLEFADLNFTQIKPVIILGLALALIVGLKIILILKRPRKKFFRADSGFILPERYQRPWLTKVAFALPRVLISLILGAVLLALAEPFFFGLREESKYVETRTRVDLRDVSGSMEARFARTGKIKAQVAEEAHLKFLEKRKGKNDRVSLWIFGSRPYLLEDFTIDEELYRFLVNDAPWEICGASGGLSSSFVAVDDQDEQLRFLKHRQIAGEGGTEMVPTLAAVIEHFDRDEKELPSSAIKRGNWRAILMITDAEFSDFDSIAQPLQELQKRRITPYVIWINEVSGTQEQNLQRFFALVRTMGGKVFPVTDSRSLDLAYQEIDRLEMVKTVVVQRHFKIPVFPIFIFAGIAGLLVIIPLGLIADFLWGETP